MKWLWWVYCSAAWRVVPLTPGVRSRGAMKVRLGSHSVVSQVGTARLPSQNRRAGYGNRSNKSFPQRLRKRRVAQAGLDGLDGRQYGRSVASGRGSRKRSIGLQSFEGWRGCTLYTVLR